MEAVEIMNMIEDASHYCCFIIDFIVRNDEITIHCVLKHPSIGARGQVLKSSKGKLDEEIPVPSLLAYPSHCVKVFARQIFYVVDNGKAHQCGCTKADTRRLKKDWECMIKKNRN